MTSAYQLLTRRRAWLPVLGPLLLAGALATGCSASSAAPSPVSSGSSSSGSSQPHGRPTGSAASAFRKALKACGDGSFPRGGNAAG